jgi:hypothetical protein
MMQAMSARVSFKVSDEVREVLARSTITPTSVKLPDGQLERKLYESVNKVLAAAGGKWDRKSGTHKFASDPREAMGLAVEKGEAVNTRTLLQSFYTPRPLADRVVKSVKLKHGMRVLEPFGRRRRANPRRCRRRRGRHRRLRHRPPRDRPPGRGPAGGGRCRRHAAR